MHFTCLAHIINLKGESFCKPLEDVSTLVRAFSHMFYMAGGRKIRYFDYLRQSSQRRMVLNTGATVQYHTKYFEYYHSFVEEEMGVCGNSALHHWRNFKRKKHLILKARALWYFLTHAQFSKEGSQRLLKAEDINNILTPDQGRNLAPLFRSAKKYISDTESGQPAIKFIKCVRVLNLRRVLVMSYVTMDASVTFQQRSFLCTLHLRSHPECSATKEN
ncbi:UNVERIFIED_CONTAM: hypothetical protein FKN15_043111 [Acipenser sinensis]